MLVDGISRRRKNEEMLAERRGFMQRLVRERDMRTEDSEEHKSGVQDGRNSTGDVLVNIMGKEDEANW